MAADYGSSVGLSERSTDIDTPPSGKANIYLKDDKNLYLKDDEGTVTKFALAGDAPTAHADTHESGGTDALELAAGQITTGQVALARGGTGGDLSGSGGSGQYVKQESSGGALSVGTIPATDITSGELPVARGGTGATDAAGARSNLSVPSLSGFNDHSARHEVGGDDEVSVAPSQFTEAVPVTKGGTGSTTAAAARTALDVVQQGASGRDEAQVTKLYDSSGNVVAEVNASGGTDVGSPATSADLDGLSVGGDANFEGNIVASDDLDLLTRSSGYGIDDVDLHFVSSALGDYSWENTVFDGTPTTNISPNSFLRIQGPSPSAIEEYFLYKSLSGGTTYRVATSRVSIASDSNNRVGVRLDDGTDDNYVMFFIEPGTTGYKFTRITRDGGGSPVSNSYLDNSAPGYYILYVGKWLSPSNTTRARIVIPNGPEWTIDDTSTTAWNATRGGLYCRSRATFTSGWLLSDLVLAESF